MNKLHISPQVQTDLAEIKQNIFVDRVLYGRRDFIRILFGEAIEKDEKDIIMPDVYEKLSKAQLEIESGNTIDAKEALKAVRKKYGI